MGWTEAYPGRRNPTSKAISFAWFQLLAIHLTAMICDKLGGFIIDICK